MCERQTNIPPSVIMIANSVGDNHQSVQINCNRCDDIKQQMLEESLAIKTSILQLHALLLEQIRLVENKTPLLYLTTNESKTEHQG